MEKIKRIKIPTHSDSRGNLSVVEIADFVDWPVKRVYYVTGVTEERGGHAVRGEKKIYICVQGKMTARIHDGEKWEETKLNGPDDAIIMNEMCYREFKDFSPGSVLLAISSMNYEPDKYIYDFEEFKKEVNN
ncbi:FdtA/QdtA family cupin domain-containing protein [Pseudomonadota bacterium]